jgi:hypothetical protein
MSIDGIVQRKVRYHGGCCKQFGATHGTSWRAFLIFKINKWESSLPMARMVQTFCDIHSNPHWPHQECPQGFPRWAATLEVFQIQRKLSRLSGHTKYHNICNRSLSSVRMQRSK